MNAKSVITGFTLLMVPCSLLAQETVTEEKEVTKVAKPTPPAGEVKDGESLAPFSAGDVTFKPATGWTLSDKATSPMRKATLDFIPEGEDMESTETAFFHFGAGQGGGVAANAARWAGQFTEKPEPKTEELTFGESKVTLVRLEGTYLSGSMFGPKTEVADHAMLGAIIESKGGDVFVKMTGAKKSVDASEEAFEKLLVSGLGEKKK